MYVDQTYEDQNYLTFKFSGREILGGLFWMKAGLFVKGTVSLDKQPRFLRITIGSCG